MSAESRRTRRVVVSCHGTFRGTCLESALEALIGELSAYGSVTVATSRRADFLRRPGDATVIPNDLATLHDALAACEVVVALGGIFDSEDDAELIGLLRVAGLAAGHQLPLVVVLTAPLPVESTQGQRLVRDVFAHAALLVAVDHRVKSSLKSVGVRGPAFRFGPALSRELRTLGAKKGQDRPLGGYTRSLLAHAEAELARQFSARGRFAEAAAAYQKAIEGGLRNASVLNNLGNALARSGQHEKARQALLSALAADPGHTEARENLTRLTRYLENVPSSLQATPSARGPRGTLSVCMIVRNEEKHLPECLHMFAGCVDEIIVVDTGSTDATVSIAQRMGAKVHHFEWIDDFAAARNESLRHATSDWILWMDADDRIAPEDLAKVHELLCEPRDRAFYFQLRSQSGDGATTLIKQIRMFPNLPGMTFRSRVHESVHRAIRELGLKVASAEITVVHTGYLIEPQAMNAKLARNLQLLQREVEDDPKDFRAAFYLAGTSSSLGDDAACIATCHRMLDDPDCQGWTRAAALGMLADYDVKERRFEQAAAKLQEARTLLPNHPQVAVQLAQAYYLLGRRSDARPLLDEILQASFEVTEFPVIADAVNAVAWYYRGRCEEDEGRPVEALDCYRKAIGFRAESLECLLRAGTVELRLERWQDAERTLRQAVAAHPNSTDAHLNLGNALAGQERVADAERAFRHALALQPDFTDASLNLASLLAGSDRMDEAEAIFRAVLAREPQNASAHHNLGCLCTQQERFEEAVAHHTKAMELGMTLSVVHYALGRALRAMGRVEDSLEELGRAINQDREFVDAWKERAEICFACGRFDDARHSYEQYLLRRPRSPNEVRHLGACHRRLGNELAARQAEKLADEVESTLRQGRNGARQRRPAAETRQPMVRSMENAR